MIHVFSFFGADMAEEAKSDVWPEEFVGGVWRLDGSDDAGGPEVRVAARADGRRCHDAAHGGEEDVAGAARKVPRTLSPVTSHQDSTGYVAGPNDTDDWDMVPESHTVFGTSLPLMAGPDGFGHCAQSCDPVVGCHWDNERSTGVFCEPCQWGRPDAGGGGCVAVAFAWKPLGLLPNASPVAVAAARADLAASVVACVASAALARLMGVRWRFLDPCNDFCNAFKVLAVATDLNEAAEPQWTLLPDDVQEWPKCSGLLVDRTCATRCWKAVAASTDEFALVMLQAAALVRDYLFTVFLVPDSAFSQQALAEGSWYRPSRPKRSVASLWDWPLVSCTTDVMPEYGFKLKVSGEDGSKAREVQRYAVYLRSCLEGPDPWIALAAELLWAAHATTILIAHSEVVLSGHFDTGMRLDALAVLLLSNHEPIVYCRKDMVRVGVVGVELPSRLLTTRSQLLGWLGRTASGPRVKVPRSAKPVGHAVLLVEPGRAGPTDLQTALLANLEEQFDTARAAPADMPFRYDPEVAVVVWTCACSPEMYRRVSEAFPVASHVYVDLGPYALEQSDTQRDALLHLSVLVAADTPEKRSTWSRYARAMGYEDVPVLGFVRSSLIIRQALGPVGTVLPAASVQPPPECGLLVVIDAHGGWPCHGSDASCLLTSVLYELASSLDNVHVVLADVGQGVALSAPTAANLPDSGLPWPVHPDVLQPVDLLAWAAAAKVVLPIHHQWGKRRAGLPAVLVYCLIAGGLVLSVDYQCLRNGTLVISNDGGNLIELVKQAVGVTGSAPFYSTTRQVARDLGRLIWHSGSSLAGSVLDALASLG